MFVVPNRATFEYSYSIWRKPTNRANGVALFVQIEVLC